ncbi:MAG: protein kinase, partial [Acidobacteria bacterium]|nr:protein kinase [Acidobacteriota bacterium]
MSRCARCFGDLNDLAVFCPHCAQVHEPDLDQLIDQIIEERYRIDRRLGQGGLSTVFAATNLESDQDVVIKISDPSQLARRDLSYAIESLEGRRYWTEMIERMRREAETLASIHHPNIVGFYGTGMINGDLRYVVMEYLRGRTLREEIANRRRIELSQAIRITSEIISALKDVHARGIVHRDINPRNIFIEYGIVHHENASYISILPSGASQSAIKLIDFGIAKFPQPPGAPPFTQHSVMSGTGAYASPEQCQSRPLDHHTDIYSLGIVLYEMLTGQRPFTGRTPTEIALKQIQAKPIPPRAINPDLPASLEKAILRALAKNPAERQQSVEEFASEMRAGTNQIIIPLQTSPEEDDQTVQRDREVMFHETVEESPDARLKLVRQRRRRVTVAAALLILLSAAGVLLGGQLMTSRQTIASNPENIAGDVSPSPAATANQTGEQNSLSPGSDADALELAARLSQENANSVSPNPQVTPSIQTQPISKPIRSVTSNSSASARIMTPTSNPLPVPPIAKPQTPPLPEPIIAVTRVPHPESEPDISQAPGRDGNNQVWRREND